VLLVNVVHNWDVAGVVLRSKETADGTINTGLTYQFLSAGAILDVVCSAVADRLIRYGFADA